MPLRFRDPIYGWVAVPDAFRSLVESPALARLRNIRQLGFTLVSYPGAVHTRFEHTLGTLEVLSRIFEKFGVSEEQEREPLLLAAIVSEVGIYPLSYTSRGIYKKYGHDKSEYAKRLFQQHLQPHLHLAGEDMEFVFDPQTRSPKWFEAVSGRPYFSYLDPVKLASTIDYVLRDSYYTGRHDAKFDFRFFLSLDWTRGSRDDADQLEALYSLHRAMDALNATYGDYLRRALTQVLLRLGDRLITSGYLDSRTITDYEQFVELDDDEFFSVLGEASERAFSEGDKLARRMFEVVTQLQIADLREVELSPSLGEAEDDLRKEQERIAEEIGVAQDQIYLLGDPFDRNVGFRMFGVDFPNYRAARSSELYRNCTGLLGSPITESYYLPRSVKVLVI